MRSLDHLASAPPAAGQPRWRALASVAAAAVGPPLAGWAHALGMVLGRFLSSMRALAPTVLAAALAIAAEVATRRHTRTTVRPAGRGGSSGPPG